MSPSHRAGARRQLAPFWAGKAQDQVGEGRARPGCPPRGCVPQETSASAQACGGCRDPPAQDPPPSTRCRRSGLRHKLFPLREPRGPDQAQPGRAGPGKSWRKAGTSSRGTSHRRGQILDPGGSPVNRKGSGIRAKVGRSLGQGRLQAPAAPSPLPSSHCRRRSPWQPSVSQ